MLKKDIFQTNNLAKNDKIQINNSPKVDKIQRNNALGELNTLEPFRGLWCFFFFKKSLSLSQLMQEVPVNRGSRVFLACAKERRRFTSLSQILCETFVKRQKWEKSWESPVNRGV